MCSLSFCRMEVHHGIRNARLQGDYSDYALTEPCPLRSTDDPLGSKDVQGELRSHGPTIGESRQNGVKRRSIEPHHEQGMEWIEWKEWMNGVNGRSDGKRSPTPPSVLLI
ncbi:unnamed protein product [Microthlaspi erraticum]|uniref:Uncharacterized protein n=1 Tax=Microthlaspi erraticum TaxID=1685480 RepID=A0A6D2JXQ7_9BRAS|nr:unnamed protein product [Microthlaspi erraticum]